MKPITTTLEIPVEATLMWKLPDGSTIPAHPETLRSAGYIEKNDTYMLVERKLREAIDAAGMFDAEYDDLTECEINDFRYLFEVAIFHPTHFTQFKGDMDAVLDRIVEIEKIIRAHEEGKEV